MWGEGIWTFTCSAHKCTPTAHSCWQLYQIYGENATCFCKFFIGTCKTGKRCRRYAGICLRFCSISLNRLQERMVHSIGFTHQAGKLKYSALFVGRGLDPADHVTKCTRQDEWDNVMIFRHVSGGYFEKNIIQLTDQKPAPGRRIQAPALRNIPTNYNL